MPLLKGEDLFRQPKGKRKMVAEFITIFLHRFHIKNIFNLRYRKTLTVSILHTKNQFNPFLYQLFISIKITGFRYVLPKRRQPLVLHFIHLVTNVIKKKNLIEFRFYF